MKILVIFKKTAAIAAALGMLSCLSAPLLSAATSEDFWTRTNGEVIEGEFLRIYGTKGVFKTPSGEVTSVDMKTLAPASAQRATKLWSQHLSRAVKRIDETIENKLVEQGLQPNEPLSDEQFVRRIYLGVVGTIPTYDETVKFLRDRDPQKRFNLVSRLLESEGHVSHMYNFYADLFRIQDVVPGTNLRTGDFGHWIKGSIRVNQPYDQFVYDMLTASGRIWEDPASGFLLRDYDTRLDHVQYTAKVLLGTDIACAQCHDDPFQEWTMMDYYRLTAFLGETKTESAVKRSLSKEEKARVREEVIERHNVNMSAKDAKDRLNNAMRRYEQPFGQLMSSAKLSVTEEKGKRTTLPSIYTYQDGNPGDIIMPLVPFGEDPDYVKGQNSQREQYARWMTSPENPRFAMNIANRIWAHLFGRPVAIPLHNIDPEATENAKLLAVLEDEMIAFGFDLKTFVKVITTTKAYNRISTRETVSEADPYYFQGPVLQRMSAEQAWDSLMTLMVEDPFRFRRGHGGDFYETATLLNRDGPLKSEEYFELAEGYADYQSRINGYIDSAQVSDSPFPKEDAMPMTVSMGSDRKEKIDGLSYGNLLLTRASEIPQPAPENHFLQIFGQSERNFIVGATSRRGSVPQIMEMMNGFAIEIITKPDSILFKRIASHRGRMEKADLVFMSILNRKMIPIERDLIYDELAANQSEAYGNLIWSLLNTPEFFFIK